MTEYGHIVAMGILATILVCHVHRKRIDGRKFYRIFIPALIAAAVLVTWAEQAL